ncbi:MAG: hypothetical protein ACKV2U_04955 [Bryobacteraceae bacterium]
MSLFDFDKITDWGPSLSAHVRGLVPPTAGKIILQLRPKYIEDARDVLLSDVCSEKAALVAAVTEWIRSQTVTAYHGSRLEEPEIGDIRTRGLLALVPGARKEHLCRKLKQHRRWQEAAGNLESVIQKLGEHEREGKRHGQTHATLSRAGLVRGFNHYLTHGSEFDQRAASRLLGDEGKELLASYGKPTLLTLAVPGDRAFEAANPWLSLVRDMPNFVREVIDVWSYWLAYPDFSVASQLFDCGLMFEHDVPPE